MQQQKYGYEVIEQIAMGNSSAIGANFYIFTLHLPCLTKLMHRYCTTCINALLCEISTSNSVGKGYKKAPIADLFPIAIWCITPYDLRFL